MKILQKLIALVLTAAMLLGCVPSGVVHVHAEETESATGGTCGNDSVNEGKDVTWTLDNGVMTISGTGKMKDYCSVNKIYSAIVSIDYLTKPWTTSEITSASIGYGVTNVGGGIFRNATHLTDVSIANSVKYIGDCAFEACYSLTQITIPESVTTVYEYAFKDCTNLSSITFAGGAPSFIDAAVFSGVTATCYYPETDATWTADVMQQYGGTIEWVAYDPCADGHTYEDGICTVCGSSTHSGTCGDNVTWTFDSATGILVLSGSGATYSYTESKADDGAIPFSAYGSQIQSIVVEEGITGIGNRLFWDAVNATSLQLPDTLTTIGIAAFEGNRFTEIVLPDSVTELKDDAFCASWYCTSLKLSDNLTYIGDYALYGFTALTELTIPASVTGMGECAIRDCNENLVITFLGSAPGNGTGAELGTCTAYYPVYDESWTEEARTSLGGGVTWIAYDPCEGGHSYDDGAVTAPTCTEQGYTTYTCTVCGDIYEEDYVEATGEHSYDAGAVTAPTCVDDGYTVYTCTVCGDTYDDDFVAATGEHSYDAGAVTAPTCVDDGYTVYTCTVCGDTYDDDFVAATGEHTYTNGVCTVCGDISWPITGTCGDDLTWALTEEGVLTISGTGAMRSGTAAWSQYRSRITSVIVEEGVTTIAASAFYSCSNMTRISLPEGLTSIGDYAFYYCYALESVELPSTVTSLGHSAFFDCRKLETVKLSRITSIGKDTFHRCYALKEIEIPDSVTSIGSYSFELCNALTEFVIPDSVTAIGDYAIANCSSLESVTVGSSVNYLGDRAIAFNDKLTNIYFRGDAPTFQYGYTFYEVAATVYYPQNNDTWTSSVKVDHGGTLTWVSYDPCTVRHSYVDGICSICGESDILASGTCGDDLTWTLDRDYVLTISGTGDMTDYGSTGALTAPWYDYADRITALVLEEGMTSVGHRAFQNLTGLTEVVIPQGVTSIGEEAFADCQFLVSLSIPGTVSSTDDDAFRCCLSLTDVTLGKGVNYIGNGMFSGCSALKSITLPGSIYAIGNNAFQDCFGLTELTIPAGVNAIGNYAFKNCTALADIIFTGDAPGFLDNTFAGLTATAWYPADDASWTDDVMQDYGGTITWRPYCTGGHNYEATVIAPTCTEQGYTQYTCAGCGDSYQENWVEATGEHSYQVEVTVETTCTEDGIWVYTCEYCGDSYKETQSALGHSYVNGICANCGDNKLAGYPVLTLDVLTDVVITDDIAANSSGLVYYCFTPEYTENYRIYSSASGVDTYVHLYDADLNQLASNDDGGSGLNFQLDYVLTAGTTYVFGIRFLNTSLTGTIPVTLTTAHSYEATVTTEPTCTTEGVATYTCQYCGISYVGTIPVVAHTYDSGTVTKPTCTQSGYTTYACVDCGYSYKTGYVSATGHSYSATVTAPTCTESGYTTYECACGASYITDDTAALGHSYEDGTCVRCQAKEPIAYGKCGDNLYWEIDDNKALIIYGSGAMYDYEVFTAPWYDYAGSITAVAIGSRVTHIGSYAFCDLSQITSITIPDNVLTIGDSALTGCGKLTEITIPFVGAEKTVTGTAKPFGYIFGIEGYSNCIDVEHTDGTFYYVPKNLTTVTVTGGTLYGYAFHNCTKLTTINLQGGVVTLQQNVFSGCTSLETVNIEGGLTAIGSYTFKDCSSLETVTIGNSVTSIGYEAFYGCSSLKNVTLPSALKSIGDRAFYNCTSLESIIIPEGITSISSATFYNCFALETLVLPESLTSIGYSAFENCSSLAALDLPAGLTSMGNYAFQGCTGLKSVTIPRSLKIVPYAAFRNCTGLTSVELPRGVTTISSYAFYGCTALTDVSMISVAKIDSYAFEGCSSLTGIELPAFLGTLGEYAFSNCSALVSFTVPENIVEVPNGLFYNCTSLQEVTLSPDTTAIGSRTFQNCTSLTSLELPEGVTTVGSYAFYGCTSLTALELPQSVTTISGHAFYSCTSLTALELPQSITTIGGYAFYSCTSLTSLELPQSITTIGSYAFADCKALTAIVMPANLTTLGEGMFYECSSLTGIELPEGITAIGAYAFRGCTALKTIAIPDSVTTIGEYAFFDCDGLETVTLGNGVTEIGRYVFNSCELLKSIVIPDSVTTIGDYAFYDCYALKTAEIGDGVTRIGEYAFSYCYALQTVTFGSSVTEIGKQAFYYCSSLQTLVFTGDAPAIQEYSFIGCSYPTAYYPVGNATWTEGVMQNYGARYVRWLPKGNVEAPVLSITADETDSYRSVLSWEAVEGAVSYDIYCLYSNGDAYANKIGSTTETTYTDTGIEPGIQGEYMVAAVDEQGGVSFFSNAQSNLSRLMAPVLVSVETGDSAGYINITWEAVEYADRYRVYRSTSPDGTFENRQDVSGRTYYHNDYAEPGTTYYYRIVAYRDSYFLATSDASNVISIDVPLRTPNINIRQQMEDQFAISWGYVEGAVSYELYRAVGVDGEYTLIGTLTGTEYVDSDLQPGRRHYYQVRAIAEDPVYNSAFSAARSIVLNLAATAVTVSNDPVTGIPTISWEAMEGAVRYDLYDNSDVLIASLTETEYVFSDLAVGESCYCYVVAIAEDEEANVRSGGVNVYRQPGQPVISVMINAETGNPVISWEAVEGANRYYIYRADSETGEFHHFNTTNGTVLSIEDYDPVCGARNYYKVVAYNNRNSAFSEVVWVDVPLRAPYIYNCYTTGNQIAISWDPVDGEASYEVYRAVSLEGEYTLIGAVTGMDYYDSDLQPGKVYYYRVKAVAQDTACSSQLSAAVSGFIRLAKPELTVTTEKTTGCPILTWTSVEGAVSYEVYDDYGLVCTTTETSYTYSSLEPEEGRSVYVHAIAEYAEASSDSSEWQWVWRYPVAAIVDQPVTQKVIAGQDAWFSVNATGYGLTYQWQYRTSSSGSWLKCTASGNQDGTMWVSATTAKSGFQYRCKVTDSLGNVKYTKTVYLYVLGIKTQPTTQSVVAGDTAVFTVSATGAGKTYQWQYRTADSDWMTTTLTGNKTATLNVPATVGRNGYQYRCQITDNAGNVIYTDAVYLHVLGIKTQPTTQKVKSGSTAYFSVSAVGVGLSYQWQYRTSSSGSWLKCTASGNQESTLCVSATASKSSYQYRCKITDSSGNVIYTNAVYLYVLGIKTQPTTQKVVAGDTAVFTVSATGAGKTYQWQYRTSSSGSWTNASATGNKTDTLSVPATTGRSGYQYRCKITDNAGNVTYTNAVYLYVLGIKTQPTGQTVSAGSTATFTVSATGHSKTYQWQYRTSSTGTWKSATATGNKTATLKVSATAAKNGYQYRCVITDSAGNVIYTDAATLTVK